MSKVLQRSMFKQPQHEHRSTGIASGLEYRDGYAVGGRVATPKRGLVDGPGGYAGHNINLPSDTALENINPDLSLSALGITNVDEDLNELFKKAQEKAEGLRVKTPDFMSLAVDRTPLARDYSGDALDFSQYAIDYDKFRPTAFEPIGAAAGRTIAEPIPVGESEVAKFISNLQEESAAFKGTRRELDMLKEEQDKKIKELTDTQAVELSRLTDESTQQMQLLNLNEAQDLKTKNMQAILDSDIANKETVASLYEQGINFYLEKRKQDVEALTPGSLTEGEQFIQLVNNPDATASEIFQSMDAFNIAGGYTKFKTNAIADFDKLYKERRQAVPGGTRKQKDIIPVPGSTGYDTYIIERNSYVADRLNNLIGSQSAYSDTGIAFADDLTLVQENIQKEFIPSFEGFNIQENLPLSAVIRSASTKVEDVRTAVINVFNLLERSKLPDGDERKLFKGITGELTTSRPIIPADVEQMIQMYAEGVGDLPPINLKPFIEIYNNAGGAAGFSNGGLVTAKTDTALKLNRDQMRMAFSPQQISDFDLTQIVNDKEMSVDFSRIKDRVDLDEFNDKYDTKIILPLA
jgi:hypothetical protein